MSKIKIELDGSNRRLSTTERKINVLKINQ